ncbi:MAG: ImmA/IrrE family metallo-endopeptidase, partial [Candidatus Sulfotelmatobacter sp.]
MTPERRRLALRASSMALRIRQQYGIALDQPCCVYDLAEKMGVEVRFAELPSAEGVYSPGKPVAIVSSLRPPGRQAFTCAHELGHHAYGHGEQFDELIEDRGKRRRYDPKEFEADCFASALLMPKTALLKGLALRRWSPKNISAAQMYALASWLGVGYATLIGNMQWGMNLLERNQAAALEKLKGPQIRESIIGCKCKEPSETTVIDSDVWPDQIDLLIEDQAGQTHHLTRARGGAVENADDPIEGPVTFPVECYGQGETQQISQRAQTDPSALLDYLDRFVDIEAETAREGELRQTLLELQSKIEEAIRKVEIIPQYERDLALAQSQIQALEKAKAKEIIVLQRKVELERQARQVITTSVQAIARGTAQEDLKKNLATLKTAADPKTLVVGSDEFASIYAQAGVFENALTSVETTVKGAATTLSTVVTEQLTAWRAKEQSILKRIDDKKRELEAQGIRVDMAYIQKLATDEARLKQDVTNLKKWKPHLEDLWKQRKEALKERWSVRARIAMKRSAFGQKASAALRASLADLNVALKFD